MKHMQRAHAREALSNFRSAAQAQGGDSKARQDWIKMNEEIAQYG